MALITSGGALAGRAASEDWNSYCVECVGGVPTQIWYGDDGCSASQVIGAVAMGGGL